MDNGEAVTDDSNTRRTLVSRGFDLCHVCVYLVCPCRVYIYIVARVYVHSGHVIRV